MAFDFDFKKKDFSNAFDFKKRFAKSRGFFPYFLIFTPRAFWGVEIRKSRNGLATFYEPKQGSFSSLLYVAAFEDKNR